MTNEIVLYQSDELSERIEVKIEEDTVWLSLNQIAQLFRRDKSVISRHLRNIFTDGELVFESTVAKNATVQFESGREVKRVIEYYNLDAILSVGYRVNSKQGTQFSLSHDRFLIIDHSEVYHLGASLKDLGKKWFAFSKLDKESVGNILKAIGNK